jgi:hypothetical protein
LGAPLLLELAEHLPHPPSDCLCGADKASRSRSLDQRRDPDRVVSLARQKDEAHEVAQGICQRQDFGRQAAAGLADSLALSPPFAPCP